MVGAKAIADAFGVPMEMIEQRSGDMHIHMQFEVNAMAGTGSKTWPDNWVVLHTDVPTENEHTNIENGRAFIYDEGDCANAWGEERDSSCPHHTMVYVSTQSDLEMMLRAFEADAKMLVVTDPNDWSVVKQKVRAELPGCFHTDDLL